MYILLLGGSPETLLWDRGPEGSWDVVVCADGGYNLALKWGIEPDWIIGDGDSTFVPYPEHIKQEKYPARKDATDCELAIDKAVELGASQVTLVGFLGGRLDHTLANILGIARRHEVRCVFEEKWGRVFFAEKSNDIFGKKGDLLSLIPVGGKCEGVTTWGLEYPLKSETLHPFSTRGISNVFLGDSCSVTVETGELLVVHLRSGVE